MKKSAFFIFVIGILIHSRGFSQDILSSTIEWNSVSTFDAQEGIFTDEITKVVSSPTQVIWYDSNGGTKQTFNVTGFEGSWPNISNNGSITIKVDYNGSSGIVLFSKTGSVRKVRIQIVFEDHMTLTELIVKEVKTL